MPNKLLKPETAQEIRLKAEAVLVKQFIDTVPVNVVKIAACENFKVLKVDPKDIPGLKSDFAGAINKEESKKMILVNINDADTRQRFTIAHELGHYFLGHPSKVDFRSSLMSRNQEELEAQEFAGNLLMPYNWLQSIIVKVSSDPKRLSEIFNVSEEAVKARIRNVEA